MIREMTVGEKLCWRGVEGCLDESMVCFQDRRWVGIFLGGMTIFWLAYKALVEIVDSTYALFYATVQSQRDKRWNFVVQVMKFQS